MLGLISGYLVSTVYRYGTTKQDIALSVKIQIIRNGRKNELAIRMKQSNFKMPNI